MAYTKPQIIAQNASSGSYAAGCPPKEFWRPGPTPNYVCRQCEITQ